MDVLNDSDSELSRFEKSTLLPASPEEVFRWHARPGAFERLVPPWQKIEVVERAPELVDGSRVRFRLHRGPIALTWVAEHEDVEPGRGFSDVQVEGPFRSWRHRHDFLPAEGSGCLLRDTIDYALPLGPLGALASSSVRSDLERVFAYRHRTTLADLELHARQRDRPRLRVAITGASGLVGRSLAALLTTGGHEVVRLVRSSSSPAEGTARWDVASGLEEADLERLEGLDAIVHLAGENIAGGRWSSQRKRRIRESRIEGTRHLVDSLKRLDQPPKAFLCASAVGFYGDRGEESLDENAEPGEGFLADVTRGWESEARRAEELGARVATMRFGVVLSPAGGALAKMLPAFRLGGGGPLGDGRQIMSWVSLDDAVAAIYHLAISEGLEGPFNVTAPQPVEQRRFAKTLGRLLHRPAFLPAPAFALRLALGEMADEALLASTRAVPEKLLASGYEFRHNVLDGALRHLLGKGSGS